MIDIESFLRAIERGDRHLVYRVTDEERHSGLQIAWG